MPRKALSDSEQLAAQLAETGASEPVQRALLLYITKGRPVGHFLRALLSNDLADTCARADATNRISHKRRTQ